MKYLDLSVINVLCLCNILLYRLFVGWVFATIPTRLLPPSAPSEACLAATRTEWAGFLPQYCLQEININCGCPSMELQKLLQPLRALSLRGSITPTTATRSYTHAEVTTTTTIKHFKGRMDRLTNRWADRRTGRRTNRHSAEAYGPFRDPSGTAP